MKIQEIMTKDIIKIHPDEPVEVAARMLTHYNIGALPVCTADGRLQGVVTDRDLVTRCLAPGRLAGMTKVKDVMTGTVVTATADMDADAAAKVMGHRQVRRLPVLKDGKLCGMVSLGDLATAGDGPHSAAEALEQISSNISDR